MLFTNKHHKLSFSHYFIFQRSVLVTFKERGHFVMLIIKSMHLINLHFMNISGMVAYLGTGGQEKEGRKRRKSRQVKQSRTDPFPPHSSTLAQGLDWPHVTLSIAIYFVSLHC